MGQALTIEQVLAKNDREVRKVECPEWGGDVYVTVMSGDQRDEYDQRIDDMSEAGTMAGMRAFIVSCCWCDEGGKSVTVTDEQLIQLGSKSSVALNRVVKECVALNGLGAAVDGVIEEQEKN